MDFYFSGSGDLKLSPSGDIALTVDSWRDDAQQAYIRLKTEPGDYLLYPNLGAHLERLYGMPQSHETGELGKAIIKDAMAREGRFAGQSIEVQAVPTGPQTIRFDMFLVSGSFREMLLSVEQDLGVH